MYNLPLNNLRKLRNASACGDSELTQRYGVPVQAIPAARELIGRRIDQMVEGIRSANARREA